MLCKHLNLSLQSISLVFVSSEGFTDIKFLSSLFFCVFIPSVSQLLFQFYRVILDFDLSHLILVILSSFLSLPIRVASLFSTFTILGYCRASQLKLSLLLLAAQEKLICLRKTFLVFPPSL